MLFQYRPQFPQDSAEALSDGTGTDSQRFRHFRLTFLLPEQAMDKEAVLFGQSGKGLMDGKANHKRLFVPIGRHKFQSIARFVLVCRGGGLSGTQRAA